MSGWTTGDWVVNGISVLVLLMGLYFVLFAERIDAAQQKKLEAEGMAESGYRSPLADTSPRTQGLILIAFGVFGLFRHLAY